MTFKHIVSSVGAVAGLAACETTIPSDDTTAPTVRISIPREANRVIASEEAPLSIELTCGPQTDVDVDAYVMSRDFPARLMLAVGDNGGVAMARAIVIGGAISNVEPADATVRSDTIGGTSAQVVEKFYDRSDPRTGQVILFDVEPTTGWLRGPNSIGINGVGADFSGNAVSTSRPMIGTQEGLCFN